MTNARLRPKTKQILTAGWVSFVILVLLTFFFPYKAYQANVGFDKIYLNAECNVLQVDHQSEFDLVQLQCPDPIGKFTVKAFSNSRFSVGKSATYYYSPYDIRGGDFGLPKEGNSISYFLIAAIIALCGAIALFFVMRDYNRRAQKDLAWMKEAHQVMATPANIHESPTLTFFHLKYEINNETHELKVIYHVKDETIARTKEVPVMVNDSNPKDGRVLERMLCEPIE